jgi:hypothetical protein
MLLLQSYFLVVFFVLATGFLELAVWLGLVVFLVVVVAFLAVTAAAFLVVASLFISLRRATNAATAASRTMISNTIPVVFELFLATELTFNVFEPLLLLDFFVVPSTLLFVVGVVLVEDDGEVELPPFVVEPLLLVFVPVLFAEVEVLEPLPVLPEVVVVTGAGVVRL